MEQHLRKQVERIIDSSGEKKLSVIVQLGVDEDSHRRVIEAAAEVCRRRNVTTSARDLLPPNKDDIARIGGLAGKKLPSTARRILDSAEASLAIQLASAFVPGAQFTLSLFKTLLNSDVVKKSVEASLARRETKGEITQKDLPRFVSSRSMVLELSKDDLAKLPKDAADAKVQDISRTAR
jgi:hypothetical protein